jgi:hypothetical protein
LLTSILTKQGIPFFRSTATSKFKRNNKPIINLTATMKYQTILLMLLPAIARPIPLPQPAPGSGMLLSAAATVASSIASSVVADRFITWKHEQDNCPAGQVCTKNLKECPKGFTCTDKKPHESNNGTITANTTLTNANVTATNGNATIETMVENTTLPTVNVTPAMVTPITPKK